MDGFRVCRHALEQRAARLEPAERVLVATPERLDLIARAFGEIIDAKSPYTYRHSAGVAHVAARVAEYMGLSPATVRDQRRAGLLHDVGKLGVSNRILDKPGKLTNTEFAAIKRHPELTQRTLARVTSLASLANLAAAHHERLDGSVYYRGVGGAALDLPSRILATADVYDALAQSRPYRDALPVEHVLAILRQESVAKLDPECVAAVETLALAGQLRVDTAPATTAPAATLHVLDIAAD